MTVHWCRIQDTPTLADAITRAGLSDGAIGFLQSATAHTPVRLRDTALHDAGSVVDLDGVYSARLFDEHSELRWQHHARGQGETVIVTEHPDRHPHWTPHTPEVTTTLDGHYAVWGRRFQPIPDVENWCLAVEGRLGSLRLPIAAPPSTPDSQPWPAHHVALTYREYFGPDDYGNLTLVEERLTGLTIATTPTGGAR